jgi:anaerobic dimethyl sulfoxide reductase subunit B (iron-sulfur subunit)
MTYAFNFDASACTGCKACQEACKDKNQLPVGVMWRRVIEVAGGEWTQAGGAWVNSVFAYNLSIACNHCVHPKCAGVCPTDAFVTRPDGIVYIDSSRCMGCGYCSWACPYSAPRYNPEQGQMAKCNFCMDDIDAGLPPACVAACPTRVLNFVSVTPSPLPQGAKQGVSVLWEIPATQHPFPLPNTSRTEPHLMVNPHVAMNNLLEKKIANYEEIRPKKQKSETSLIVFTVLVQMAVGAFWAAQWMVDPIPLSANLAIGACLGLGGLFSFAHLGAKRNAWHAVSHLKKSWLSREILYVGSFGAGWLTGLLPLPPPWLEGVGLFTFLLGIGLIFSMAQVYRLHTMPAWDTWRTPAGFFITSILLGHLAMMNLLQTTRVFPWILIAALLVLELGLTLTTKSKVGGAANSLRVGLIVAAALGAGIISILPNLTGMWSMLILFMLVIIEEIIGRALFYTALEDKPL